VRARLIGRLGIRLGECDPTQTKVCATYEPRLLDFVCNCFCMEAKSRLKRGAIHIAGWGFILLGIIGLVLPILQGILFILVGLLLL
jgi:hypothetical protein